MSKLWYVTGELTEVQHYINVSMRWCEQYPERERRACWLARTDGIDQDMKLVIHSRSMPAQRAHEVCVLLLGELVVGLMNLSTGQRVNFVRPATTASPLRCAGSHRHLRRERHPSCQQGCAEPASDRSARLAVRTLQGTWPVIVANSTEQAGRSRLGHGSSRSICRTAAPVVRQVTKIRADGYLSADCELVNPLKLRQGNYWV